MGRPFLKWPGGKYKMLKQIDAYLPIELKFGQIERYIEPFVGGGSLLFYLLSHYPVKEVFISDKGKDLILGYRTVRDCVEQLIECLQKVEMEYLSLSLEDRNDYYTEIRTLFNQQRSRIDYTLSNQASVNRTVQLIFLNKTCFNGLFRVNKKGDFNTPMGKYDKPRICDSSLLLEASKLLRNVQINITHYSKTKSLITPSSFIYLDPPYKEVSETSNFKAYTSQGFTDSDQIELSNYFKYLDSKKALGMLSNSYVPSFFNNLYDGFQINIIKSHRAINSKSKCRGKIPELLITNY